MHLLVAVLAVLWAWEWLLVLSPFGIPSWLQPALVAGCALGVPYVAEPFVTAGAVAGGVAVLHRFLTATSEAPRLMVRRSRSLLPRL